MLCVTGDGGFMFNASELSTAVKYGINLVTVAFFQANDAQTGHKTCDSGSVGTCALYTERVDREYGKASRGPIDEFFHGTYGTDLHNPDFVKFAESFGAVGMRAEDPMDGWSLL